MPVMPRIVLIGLIVLVCGCSLVSTSADSYDQKTVLHEEFLEDGITSGNKATHAKAGMATKTADPADAATSMDLHVTGQKLKHGIQLTQGKRKGKSGGRSRFSSGGRRRYSYSSGGRRRLSSGGRRRYSYSRFSSGGRRRFSSGRFGRRRYSSISLGGFRRRRRGYYRRYHRRIRSVISFELRMPVNKQTFFNQTQARLERDMAHQLGVNATDVTAWLANPLMPPPRISLIRQSTAALVEEKTTDHKVKFEVSQTSADATAAKAKQQNIEANAAKVASGDQTIGGIKVPKQAPQIKVQQYGGVTSACMPSLWVLLVVGLASVWYRM